MMRVWWLLACLGCGRLSFDSRPTDDATMPTDDNASRGWWNTDWNRRIKLRIDNAAGPQLGEFPLLVKLDSTRINYADARPTGDDLRVIDGDDVTPLAFDIEQWGVGSSVVWVRVPQIAAGSTHTLYLYYGNASAPAAASASSTWSFFSLVYHLSEIPTGANDVADSTPNNNRGTTQGGMGPGQQNTGMLGGSLAFDGTDDFINAPGTASLRLTGDLTIEMWLSVATVREQWLCDFVVPGSESEINNHLYELAFDTSNNLELGWEYGAGIDEMAQTSATVSTPMNTWHHIAVTRDTTALQTRFYIDGAQYGTPVSFVNNATGGSAASFYLAGQIDGTSTKATLAGRLDEVRFIDKVLTPGFIAANYRSMTDQLITYNAPEPL